MAGILLRRKDAHLRRMSLQMRATHLCLQRRDLRCSDQAL